MLAAGLAFSIIFIAAAGFWAGGRPHRDNALTAKLVTGLVLGTFIGGSSTIGTAQLAYRLGMPALWFCLGGAAGCLFLAFAAAGPLRRSGSRTIMGVLAQRYGEASGLAATALNSLGTFISILVQLISATSILAVVLPGMPRCAELLFAMLAMTAWVVFGGSRGAGIAGLVKILLICTAMLLCGLAVLDDTGGPAGFAAMVAGIPNPDGIDFMNLFGRGVGTDLGACLSLIVGMATTQIYAQAIIRADTTAHAREGLVMSALVLPLPGLCGVAAGLWMRANCPGIVDKTALTQFILMQFPDVTAGVFLGALFISVVGTGAGLALGIASVIVNDVIEPHAAGRPRGLGHDGLLRLLIVLVLGAACAMCLGVRNETILLYAFASMALRGGGIIAPLSVALFTRRRASGAVAAASMLSGAAVVLLFNVWRILPCDPLIAGMIVSAAVLAAGLRRGEAV